MKPKISIIVPVYNVEKYLTRCLESIQNQTYTNLEIILINDGSTDASGQICDHFMSVDSRFEVIHQSNRGSSSARNAGLDIASGKYIGFVDSDDHIKPSMYAALYEIASSEDLSLVACDFELSTGNKIKNSVVSGFEDHYKIVSIEEYISTINIAPNGIFPVWNKLFHKDLINDLYFIEDRIHQDALFVSEALLKTNRVGLLNKSLYIYFDLNESITRSKFGKKNVDAIEVILMVKQNLCRIATNKSTQRNIGEWLLKWMLYTYGNLCAHPNLDKNRHHRGLVRKVINENKSNGKDIRLIPVLILPSWLYKYAHRFYMSAIKVKSKLKSTFRSSI